MTSFIVSLTVSLAARLTVIMIAGGLAAFAARRSSYAVRHVIIAVTLACAIALPPLMILMPEWRVGILPAELSILPDAGPTPVTTHITPAAPAPSKSAPAKLHEMPQTIRPVLVTSALDIDGSQAHAASERVPFTPSVPQLGFGIWMLGVLLGLAWIAIGQLGLARVRRHATPLRSIDWRALLELERMHAGVAADVALLSSPKVSTPVTWGIFKPVIVLPESAREWTEERKRVVVRHEMAHIARRDAATQLAATIASVIYWIHPLVIVAAQRLRGECERACDERVLEMGTPPTDYAAHLLDVAKLARSFGAASIVSVAMARPSQLEGRLLAVLRAEPSRARVSARSRVAAMVSAAMMLIAISAFKPVQREVQVQSSDRDSVPPRVAPRPPLRPIPATPATPATPAMPATPATPATPAAPAAPAPSAAPAAPATSAVPATPATPASPATPAVPAVPATPAPEAFPRMSMFSKVVSLPKFAASFPGLARTFQLDTKIMLTGSMLGRPLADSIFERTVPAHEGGTLELDLDTGGDVEIIGTDDQKVSVHGSLSGRDWRETTIALEEHDGDASLVSRYIGSSSEQSFDNAFQIRVPKRFNVRVMSAGGDVHITGVDGTFSGSTGGGKIAIEHANGEAHLSTGGGDVHVAKSKLDGSVSTGGGTVRFDDVTGGIVGSSGSSESMRFRGGTYDFRMPEMKSLSRLSEIGPEVSERTREAMKASHDAMRASNEAMKMSQKELWRVQKKMADDSDFMKNMDSTMEISRITIDRNRGAMDSARIYIERHRGEMDSARSMMERYRGDGWGGRDDAMRDRTFERHRSRVISRNGVIVIDKDGGDIELEDAPGGAHVTTGGGAISVGHSRGAVSAQTGGGDIELGDAEGSAEATTGAGDVSINLVGEGAHPVNISSGTGNVELVLPRNANATLDIETAYTEHYGKRTKIKSDWPLDVTETQEWDDSHGTPRKYVRVKQKIGKGGPLIRIRTVNGDIRIKQGS